MSARTKLNAAFAGGSLVLAALVGVAAQSWVVFLLTLAALLAGNLYLREIRPGGRRRR